jgi:lipopolysaccharide exporter
MSGTAVAQIVGFALAPIISRLFEPDDFGVFGSFSSVLSIVGVAVTLQYSMAIMLPKEDKEAANIFAVSLMSSLIISLASLFVGLFFADFLLKLLNAPKSKWLLWLLPLAIFVSGVNQSFQAWCVRRKAFKKTASSQIVRAGCVNALQIATGLAQAGSGGLITSSVIANGCSTINLSLQVISDKKLITESLKWNHILLLAKEYRDFPLYSATQNLLNALAQGLPVLLLAHFYGVGIAGAYAFGSRMLQVPYNLILIAFRQVFFQKASETYNQGQEIFTLFIKATSCLAALSIPIAIMFFFWASEIFSFLFGSNWREAGLFAGWLVLWLSVGVCITPSVLFARLLRKQRQLLIYETVFLILSVISLCVGGFYLNAYSTVILFSVVGMLLNSILIVWSTFVIKFVHPQTKSLG